MGSTVRWSLFETVAGDWFVRFLERSVGIGVVVVDKPGEGSSGVVGVARN
jgi:hypothetical protein